VEGRANIGIFSKVQLLRARSMCAEGRTAAVLRAEEGDSVQLHAWDTVKGSDFLAGLNVAWQFAETSPKEILQLEHWGIPWTQDNQGRITQRPLPAAIHLGR
jgi:succinate dehydrogenase / fumarate reductase flavoprotein subunit